MDTEPVSFHEFDPANHRAESRVDLMYLNSLTMAAGDEVGLDLAVAERRQHPAVPAGLALQDGLLLTKVQLLDNDGLPSITGVLDHPSHRIADQSLSLMSALAIGDQRHPPSVQAVSRGIGLRDRQIVKGVDKTYQWGGAKVYHQRGHWPA